MSDWLYSVESFKENKTVIQSRIEESLIYTSNPFDDNTSRRLNASMRARPPLKNVTSMIILITDFVSEQFIRSYEGGPFFASMLSRYDFHIVCTVEEVCEDFQNKTSLSPRISFFNYSNPIMIPIDGHHIDASPSPPGKDFFYGHLK